MRRQIAATAILTGTLVAGSMVSSAAVAFADDPSTCDAYSNVCPTPSPTAAVKGVVHERVPPGAEVEGTSTSLPFTGGEITLMTIAGLGAIGAGTVLVVSGRRRRHAQH